jgi:plasmid replication initiation protein
MSTKMPIINNHQPESIEKKLRELRDYKVVKSNDLIQKSRYHLSLQEQKVILYLISKIRPNQDEFESYNFKIVEFCKVCGIETDSGKNYKNVKDTIKTLADRSIWMTMENGKETLLRIIEKAYIDPESGVIEIRIDNDMKPYLLHLKERFTQYELLYTLAMRSQYSVHLYELFKSYAFQHNKKFDIEALKKKLMAEKYKNFPDFQRNVLNIAVREINDVSDIFVEYQIIREGHKYTQIEFSIKLKEDLDERMETWSKIFHILDAQDHDPELPAKIDNLPLLD